jgi:hypothetical protein
VRAPRLIAAILFSVGALLLAVWGAGIASIPLREGYRDNPDVVYVVLGGMVLGLSALLGRGAFLMFKPGRSDRTRFFLPLLLLAAAMPYGSIFGSIAYVLNALLALLLMFILLQQRNSRGRAAVDGSSGGRGGEVSRPER